MKTKLNHLFLRYLFCIVGFMCSANICYADYDAYDFTVDGVYYEILSNTTESKTVMVTFKYWDEGRYEDYPRNDYSGDIVIPSSVNYNSEEYEVIAIGRESFSGSSITSIALPNGITSIAFDAFENCRNLTSVTIPQSVKSIGSGAFDGCTNLVSANIPEGVTSIYGVFANCRSLSSIVIPNSVSSIGSSTFQNCISLASVNIPDGVTSIGQSAFQGCSSLASINIPSGVTSISESLFSGCSSLSSVIIPDGVTTIGNYAFHGCSSLASLIIPTNVNTIGGSAFKGCTSLSSLAIPNDVVSVGSLAFEDTPWYDSLPEGVVYIGKALYKYKGTMPDNTTISVKDGTVTITASAFYGCVGLSTVDIPNSITSIGNSAFYDCSSLFTVYLNSNALTSKTYYSNSPGFKNIFGTQVKEYILGDDISQIGQCAFYGCESLNSVNIPNSVTVIGTNAFYGCTSLIKANYASIESLCNIQFNGTLGYFANPLYYAKRLYINDKEITNVVIPEGVISIGQFVFYNGTRISSVTIPESVTSIGRDAFYGTQWYNNQPDGVVYAGTVAYTYKGTMPQNTEIEIKEGTTAIADSAFSFKRNLVSITIPKSVNSIGRDAFYYCDGLTKAEFGSIESLCNIQFKNYASNPLYYAKHLYINGEEVTDVSIPNSVTTIGASAFSGCSNITSLYIPRSVTSIGAYAFSGCSNLATVHIPSSVSSIGENAFAGCSSLIKSEFNSIESLCKIKFEDVFANPLCYAKHLYINGIEVEKVYIPSNVSSINDYAFYNCSSLTSVSIPSNVTNIGNSAFSGCESLITLIVKHEMPITISSNTFSNRAKATLYIPYGSRAEYENADFWNGFREIIEMPKSSDCLTMNDLSICKGGKISLPVSMENEKEITAFQFDIEVPQGITVIDVQLGDRKSDSHTITFSKQEDGSYRVIAVSLQSSPFNGNEGELVSLMLSADKVVESGDYNIGIKNIVLTSLPKRKLYPADVNNVLTVLNVKQGDADGDEFVDVADIVAMVNYILDCSTSDFIFIAADMNADGEIDIFDVMIAINLILNRDNSAGSRTRASGNMEEEAMVTATTDDIMLGINDANRFTAFQFDIEVADGMELTEAHLNGNAGNHKLYFLKNGQNAYRVIGVSMDNSTLATSGNDLIRLSFSKCGHVQISNIVFVTPQKSKVNFASGNSEVTGIDSIEYEQAEDIFDLSGRKVNIERSRLPKGVYIINNKKVVIK